MSWYDYIPVAGSVARLAQGDYTQAAQDQFSAGSPFGEAMRYGAPKIAGGVGGIGDMDFMGWNEKKQGYEDAIKNTYSLADRMRDFQMEGLNRAEGYYQPAQQQIESIYGKPGQMRK